jgi:hypothetical protein
MYKVQTENVLRSWVYDPMRRNPEMPDEKDEAKSEPKDKTLEIAEDVTKHLHPAATRRTTLPNLPVKDTKIE